MRRWRCALRRTGSESSFSFISYYDESIPLFLSTRAITRRVVERCAIHRPRISSTVQKNFFFVSFASSRKRGDNNNKKTNKKKSGYLDISIISCWYHA
jgi:hypothetical protein